jgi:peptide-methionine (R)-S-oxide reductase
MKAVRNRWKLGALLALAGAAIIFYTLAPLPHLQSEEGVEMGTQDATPEHLRGLDTASIDWKAKDLDYWRSVLSAERFQVCRLAGTERPFSGTYCHSKAQGSYHCSCCGLVLFSSDNKFDSGTGWPSFTDAAKSEHLELLTDNGHGMQRTEVRCKRCGAHLGHVFDDGPAPSGKRYCINSVCLYQEP